jgi:tetratricopeptide (TPR) repeat protein
MVVSDRIRRVLSSLALVLCVALVAGTAEARKAEQEQQDAKKFGISRPVAEKLLEAYDLLEAERFDEALEVVDDLAERRKLQPPETAQIHRFRAYIYVNKGQSEKATGEFEKSLALNAMEPEAEQVMMYSLAQIYTELGRYDEALALINRWFGAVESPKADAYFLKAMILVQQKNFEDAAEPSAKALELSKTPKESWLTLDGVIQTQLKNYARVEKTLEQLVELAPAKAQYWTQLAAVQQHLEHEEKALATMQLAYKAGLLKGEKELRQLASLLFIRQQPYECAQVIQRGLTDGVVRESADAYRLIANCLISAREVEKALEPLAKAGELSTDGSMYLLLGQLHLQRDRFDEAIAALEKGLEKVEPAQRGSAHLLLGIALLGNEQLVEAQQAFQVAADDAKVGRAAESYLKFLETKQVAQQQPAAGDPGGATGG